MAEEPKKESLFKTAYDLQTRLAQTQPEHELVTPAPLMKTASDSYLADGIILAKYSQNGIDNQLRAYICSLEAALAQKTTPAKND